MHDITATLPPSRSVARIALVIAILVLALLLATRYALQPQRASRFLLERLGNALGLQITATGANYRLRGTPQLVLHGVVAREPGAGTPLLRAQRLYVSLPWSTIRARGNDPTVQRIELDAPRLDLPAWQHWVASRPPSKRRIPTLTQGVRIHDGSIHNDGWDVDRIELTLQSLYPDKPVQAQLRARYLAPPLSIPVDIAIALVRPAALLGDTATGFAVRGKATISSAHWQVPATLALSGSLRLQQDSLQLQPARAGIVGSFHSDKTDLPFTLGLAGALRFDQATLVFAPATLLLHGDEPLPTLSTRGALALGKQLALRLQGRIAHWPQSWPALPPPLSASTSPLPFALDYTGAGDLGGIASLYLQRDASDFHGRFRLPDVVAWIDATPGSPLPPLDGRLTTPELDIAGAQLHGVEIEIDDPDVPAATNPP